MNASTRIPSLLAILAIPLSCHDPTPPVAASFYGFYRAGFEVSSFERCGSGDQWWVLTVTDLSARYAQLGLREYEPAFVAVDGWLSPLGTYGHLGAYTRQLEVTRVPVIHAPSPGDCP